jgi:hypothetical protein
LALGIRVDDAATVRVGLPEHHLTWKRKVIDAFDELVDVLRAVVAFEIAAHLLGIALVIAALVQAVVQEGSATLVCQGALKKRCAVLKHCALHLSLPLSDAAPRKTPP